MRQTDYKPLAPRYDQNRRKFYTKEDEDLAALLHRSEKPLRICDLGCGTGLWLQCNDSAHVQLHGVDPSEDMLNQCREKGLSATLHCTGAEDLPFADEELDFVISNVSFHHFVDKEAAIKELARVITPGGTFKMFNIAPELSQTWWVYNAIPETKDADAERFWSLEHIERTMTRHGFSTKRVIHPPRATTREEAVAELNDQVTSQLALLNNDACSRGLGRLKEMSDIVGPTMVAILATKNSV